MKWDRFGSQSRVLRALLTLGITTSVTTMVSADLTWEHTGDVRFSGMKHSLLKFKSFTNMTPQRMRVLFKYDAGAALGALPGPMNAMPPGFPGMPGMGGPLSAGTPMQTFARAKTKEPTFKQVEAPASEAMPPNPLLGSVTFVQRFDDGQFIAYTSFNKQYVGEPIKEAIEKTRFDPWKTLAPKLSKELPPSFTAAQRARLGAEVRALIWPFMKSMVKIYFRPLAEKRTFNGMEGNGYRLTMLMNSQSPFSNGNQWFRVSAEWWIANALPGDEVVGQLREAADKTVGRDPQRSTSIWMNEMPWVMWEMLPEEFHQAFFTLVPRFDAAVDSPEFRRANMPLYGAITIQPPTGMRDAKGDLRIEVKLTRRGQETLPDHIWQAPTGYKRVPLDDIMKQFEKLGGAMPPFPTPPM